MFRYPGGKKKLKRKILSSLLNLIFLPNSDLEYREPFFGSGAIGLSFLSICSVKNVWLNDKDRGIACFWNAVIFQKNELKQLIKDFVPSVALFNQYREDLLVKAESVVLTGFKKLAVHQMSFSGLGLKAGGPIGGKTQNGLYKIDCRWNASRLCKEIDRTSQLLQTRKLGQKLCTALDFQTLIEDDTRPAILYLDPPYFKHGNELYLCGFTSDDHIRLVECLKKTKHKWILSYDYCKEILDLYSWAKIQEVGVMYTIDGVRETKELLIGNNI